MIKITVDQVTPNVAIYKKQDKILSIFKDGRVQEAKKYVETKNFKEIEITQEQEEKIEELMRGCEEDDIFSKLKNVDFKKVLESKFTKSEKFSKAMRIAVDNEENLIVFGPGGYGKSDMIKTIMKAAGIDDKVFYMSCGEDTDESKLWGGIDIPEMKNGNLRYNIKDSFINYQIVVFEELLDAQVNALLALKDTLEAKEFRKGSQRQKIKTKMVIALTNKSPEEISQLGDYAKALMERFRIELNHKWDSYKGSDYLELLTKRFNPKEKDSRILKTMSSIFETIAKKKSPICPRIAIAATKVALKNGSEKIEDIMDEISYVHELSGIENIRDVIVRGRLIGSERDFIEITHEKAKAEYIKASRGEVNPLETIKGLKNRIKEIESKRFHDETYNESKSTIKDINEYIQCIVRDSI